MTHFNSFSNKRLTLIIWKENDIITIEWYNNFFSTPYLPTAMGHSFEAIEFELVYDNSADDYNRNT